MSDPAPRRPDRPRDPRKRGPILFWFVLSLVALSLGVLGIVDAAGLDVHGSAYPALALGIIAAGLLVGAFFGRAGGLILLGILASFGLVAGTIADKWDGTQVHAVPATADQLDSLYEMSAGEIVLDLSEIQDLDQLDGRSLRVDGDAGRIEVRIPVDGLDVNLDADIEGAGEIRAFDHKRSGWEPSLRASHDGGVDVPTLDIETDLTFGEISVELVEASR